MFKKDQFILNPTHQEMEDSKLNLMIAGTEDGILMIEGEADFLTEEQIHALRIQGARGKRLKVKKGKGCVKCRHTGYLGRTGLFEVMTITPRIQRLINERASSQEIMREAMNDGMLSLREYGIKKIASGETTFEEVMSLTDEKALY